MRVRRRWVLVAVGVVGALLILWIPSFVAQRYSLQARPTDFLVRPDKGWQFLYQSMRLSRGAKLGSDSSARDRATEVWGRRARSVRLVYVEGPFAVPVPPGGYRPRQGRVARPGNPLVWVVSGTVRRGVRQTIGLMDYASGRVLWDIRPRPGTRP